jgi:predicted secreted protein
MFAQYGITEISVYSDLYTVDVLKNNFVPNGVINKKYNIPAYSMEDGSGAFYNTLIASQKIMDKTGIDPMLKGRCLYVNVNSEPVHNIEFRDFKEKTKYKINLVENSSATSGNFVSSFVLKVLVEKDEMPAKVYEAGSLDIKRKDIKGYSIKTIFISPDNKGVVFVIEKTVVEKNSTSIRYMVETLKL